jgi:hypothetical protein
MPDTASAANTQNQRPADAKKWWCNFCNFTTDDTNEYLAHSCKEVLAKGETPAPDPQRCG